MICMIIQEYVPESTPPLSLCSCHIFIHLLHCYGSMDAFYSDVSHEFGTAAEQVLIPFSSSLSVGELLGKASVKFLWFCCTKNSRMKKANPRQPKIIPHNRKLKLPWLCITEPTITWSNISPIPALVTITVVAQPLYSRTSSVNASVQGKILLINRPRQQVPMKRNTLLLETISSRRSVTITPTYKRTERRGIAFGHAPSTKPLLFEVNTPALSAQQRGK